MLGVVVDFCNELNFGWQCIAIKLRHLIAIEKNSHTTLFANSFTEALEFKDVIPAIGMKITG